MKQLNIRVKGESPLMTHNVQLANPLGKYAQTLKPLTSKRNKTDSDLMEIARIEWEGGLYLNNGRVHMPIRCLNAAFYAGAKKRKNGPRWKTGAVLDGEPYYLDYNGPKISVEENGKIPNPELDKFYEKLCDIDLVKVSSSMVPRARPIFFDWSIPCVTILYDENIVDERTLMDMCKDAGYLVGLCERRPGSSGSGTPGTFGRFSVEKVK